MTELRDFSVTASANGAISAGADGGYPEGMAYSNVNDSGRENQAILARDRADRNGTILTTGASSSYNIAINASFSAYQDGDMWTFMSHAKNAGATTLKVSTLSSLPVVQTNLSALVDGQIAAGGVYQVVYKSASANSRQFQLLNPSTSVNQSFEDLTVGNNLSVSGNTVVNTLTADGLADMQGIDSHGDVSVSGNLAVAGTVNIQGNVDIQGTLSASAVPAINLTFDLPSMTGTPVVSDEILMLDGGVLKTASYDQSAKPVNTDANTHTFADTDVGTIRVYTGTTAADAWTMNTGVGKAGVAIIVVNDSASTDGPTITAGTATIETSAAGLVVKQNGVVALINIGSNVWKATGDLKA